MPKNWDTSHDPDARPLGCNGAYGTSGAKAHRRKGQATCDQCRASEAHYARELRRGQGLPRPLHPCGTPAAYKRHKERGEPIDFACRVGRSRYTASNRARRAAAKVDALEALHAEGALLAKRILSRRRRRCLARYQHTPGHCQTCGVHSPAGRLQLPAPTEQRTAA